MGETKLYLYRLRPTRFEMLVTGQTSEEAECISQHFKHLQHLTEQGIVILAGRTLTTDQDSMGIVIFKACSDEEARALMSAKLFPFRIALQATADDPNERIQTGSGDK